MMATQTTVTELKVTLLFDDDDTRVLAIPYPKTGLNRGNIEALLEQMIQADVTIDDLQYGADENPAYNDGKGSGPANGNVLLGDKAKGKLISLKDPHYVTTVTTTLD